LLTFDVVLTNKHFQHQSMFLVHLQVYYVLLQLQGLEDGYNHNIPNLSIHLDPFGIL